MSDEHETSLKIFNDNEKKEILSSISTDTTNVSTHSTVDESFYEVPSNDDSLTSVVHTTE
jgi:hypothetical protein